MFVPAIALVEASVLRDGGICCSSQEVVAEDKYFLEYENVQFRCKAPKGGTVIDIFSAFLKECSLLPKSKTRTQYHGKEYWRWSNSNGSVFFDAEFNPTSNEDKPGFAGRCIFYAQDDAPMHITRTLRGALAKACTNVSNNHGNKNPIDRNKEAFKTGPSRMHEHAAKIRDTIKLDPLKIDNSNSDDSSIEDSKLNLSPVSIEFYERLLRGDHHRARIN